MGDQERGLVMAEGVGRVYHPADTFDVTIWG